MQFKAISNLNLRSGPGANYPVVGIIPAGNIVEGDNASPWKFVTFPNGTGAYCAAACLQAVPEPPPPSIWHAPVPQQYFVVTQPYLNEDWNLYPKFGHHTGVDYGGHGTAGNTGTSANGAIHLHLEGFHGRFQVAWRTFTSLADIKQKTFDADQYIRARL